MIRSTDLFQRFATLDASHRLRCRVPFRILLRWVCTAFTALVGSMMTAGMVASAGEINLRVHHPMGPNSTLHKDVLVPWVEDLALRSEGRIDSVVNPAMRLGGSPLDLYDQVRSGIVDIAWLPIDYAGDEFIRTRVFELPTVHIGSGLGTSKAMLELRDDIAADFSEVEVLLLYAHPGNLLHMRSKLIDNPLKLSGLRIRPFSLSARWLVEAWSADVSPVAAHRVPDALADDELDGVLLPFSLSVPYRVPETISYTHVGLDGDRFGTDVYVLLMNKAVYGSLPADLRQLIDDTTSEQMLDNVNALLGRDEDQGRSAHKDAQVGLIRLTGRRMSLFNQAAEVAVKRWLSALADEGIDGTELLEKARRSVKRNSTVR